MVALKAYSHIEFARLRGLWIPIHPLIKEYTLNHFGDPMNIFQGTFLNEGILESLGLRFRGFGGWFRV